jgi:hypothetical protein
MKALNRMQNLSDLSKIIIGDSNDSYSSESTITTDKDKDTESKSYNFSKLYVKDVYDAASIMNKTLNSVPIPLIPFDKYDSIIIFGCMLEVSLADIIENEKFINKIKSEIATLPKPHAKTLELLSKYSYLLLFFLIVTIFLFKYLFNRLQLIDFLMRFPVAQIPTK